MELLDSAVCSNWPSTRGNFEALPVPAACPLPCRAAARAASRSGAPAGDVSVTRWQLLDEVVRKTVGGLAKGHSYTTLTFGAWRSVVRCGVMATTGAGCRCDCAKKRPRAQTWSCQRTTSFVATCAAGSCASVLHEEPLQQSFTIP